MHVWWKESGARHPHWGRGRSLLGTLVDVEERRQVIRETLKYTGGQATKAAKILGIHRVVLYKYMRMTGLSGEPARIRSALKRRFLLPGLGVTA